MRGCSIFKTKATGKLQRRLCLENPVYVLYTKAFDNSRPSRLGHTSYNIKQEGEEGKTGVGGMMVPMTPRQARGKPGPPPRPPAERGEA